MSIEDWTNVVIGSGECGKYLAWHLASLGQKTLVVERRWIGGSCPAEFPASRIGLNSYEMFIKKGRRL